jgi:hypothetical protein
VTDPTPSAASSQRTPCLVSVCVCVQTFWDHEWNRHGTCAAPVTGGQHRYFQAVLALHHKLNLQVCSIQCRECSAVDERPPAAWCAICRKSITLLLIILGRLHVSHSQADVKPTTKADTYVRVLPAQCCNMSQSVIGWYTEHRPLGSQQDQVGV